jgi:hypothetical protein
MSSTLLEASSKVLFAACLVGAPMGRKSIEGFVGGTTAVVLLSVLQLIFVLVQPAR